MGKVVGLGMGFGDSCRIRVSDGYNFIIINALL
jgi:hypothetical protein